MIAAVLGVRRESVTEAAGDLQRAASSATGADTSRARARRIDARVCECYGVVKRQMHQLLEHVEDVKRLAESA